MGDPDVTETARPASKPRPAARRAKCPVCGKPAADDTLPFCSKRCAKIDLNRWLSGTYVISASAEGESATEADTASDPSNQEE